MTGEKLQELYYLHKEIELWQKELIKIRSKQIEEFLIISDYNQKESKHSISDNTAEVSAYEEKLSKLLVKAQQKQRGLLDYIDTIDDSLLKQIVYLRNLNLLEWEEVAIRIGGGNSTDGIKKKYYRFLKNNQNEHKCSA